jgi:hypothetical protein
MIEKIIKLARTEADWLRYYGFVDSRMEENFEDIGFYDRMAPIGYSKVYTPLAQRCPMGFVNSLDPDKAEIVSGPRRHDKGVYTPLELVIYNKIDGYLDMIRLIKGQ